MYQHIETLKGGGRSSIKYNEQKREQGIAKLILAKGFFQEPEDLDRQQIIQRFKMQNDLNTHAKNKMIAFTLSFNNKDTLSTEELINISHEFMRNAGFEDKPYVAYQHFDSSIPHVHLISTLIGTDGKRFHHDYHYRARLREICRKLDKKYELVSDKSKSLELSPQKENTHVFRFDQKSETIIEGLNRILPHVLNEYNYTNLEELNAVLFDYSVKADRGKENTSFYNKGHLSYYVSDISGKNLCKGVLAKKIKNNPDLKFLEKRFLENQTIQTEDLNKIKNTVISKILANPESFEDLKQELSHRNILIQIKRSSHLEILNPEKGHTPFQLYYRDVGQKIIAKDSRLGAELSVDGLLDQWGKNVYTAKGISEQRKWQIKLELLKSTTNVSHRSDQSHKKGYITRAITNAFNVIKNDQQNENYKPEYDHEQVLIQQRLIKSTEQIDAPEIPAILRIENPKMYYHSEMLQDNALAAEPNVSYKKVPYPIKITNMDITNNENNENNESSVHSISAHNKEQDLVIKNDDGENWSSNTLHALLCLTEGYLKAGSSISNALAKASELNIINKSQVKKLDYENEHRERSQQQELLRTRDHGLNRNLDI